MRPLLIAAALLAPLPALAHPGAPHVHGFGTGFIHPLVGIDHLVAMIAVGLWAAMAGGRARLALPAGFLGGMTGGALLGLAGLGLPMVEQGILATIIVLGALVGAGARLPVMAAVPMLAVFGLLHGHAHGTELEGGGLEAVGVLLATALLHGAGLLAGWRAAAPPVAMRLAGGATAAVALAVLIVG
jgi:urease accessory protein